MELSIIVTNYKNPQLLKLCLNSIFENLPSIETEVIVCDSETDDEIKEIMREEYPKAIFFPHDKNVGFQHLIKKRIG